MFENISKMTKEFIRRKKKYPIRGLFMCSLGMVDFGRFDGNARIYPRELNQSVIIAYKVDRDINEGNIYADLLTGKRYKCFYEIPNYILYKHVKSVLIVSIIPIENILSIESKAKGYITQDEIINILKEENTKNTRNEEKETPSDVVLKEITAMINRINELIINEDDASYLINMLEDIAVSYTRDLISLNKKSVSTNISLTTTPLTETNIRIKYADDLAKVESKIKMAILTGELTRDLDIVKGAKVKKY